MDWDITYTPQNSQNFSAQIVQTIGGAPDYIRFIMGTVTGSLQTNTYATLDFSTVQLGVPLAPGTYDNAERAAFATPGHPGLDVSFQNRGSNTLTGSFTITDFTTFINSSNQLEIRTFAASYSQMSDNNTSIISGTFTYNPQLIPEAPSIVLLGLGTLTTCAVYGRSRFKRSRVIG
jgi:hypothetical protein